MFTSSAESAVVDSALRNLRLRAYIPQSIAINSTMTFSVTADDEFILCCPFGEIENGELKMENWGGKAPLFSEIFACAKSEIRLRRVKYLASLDVKCACGTLR